MFLLFSNSDILWTADRSYCVEDKTRECMIKLIVLSCCAFINELLDLEIVGKTSDNFKENY